MAAVSYHPQILSPKYGQMGNVKPLIVNRSLSFAVKWQHLDLKVSYKSLPNQEIIGIQNDIDTRRTVHTPQGKERLE